MATPGVTPQQPAKKKSLAGFFSLTSQSYRSWAPQRVKQPFLSQWGEAICGLGWDEDIASLGWAVLECDGEGSGCVRAAGVRGFDAPEIAKERTPTNRIHRLMRGQRRGVRRRGQRMAAIRALPSEVGLHHPLVRRLNLNLLDLYFAREKPDQIRIRGGDEKQARGIGCAC